VYFELSLIFLGGVFGTGHHLYWAGGPRMWVPLGSMVSFIEVLPLVFLIIEAIQQHRLIRLAIGLICFCLRYAAADRVPFGERLGIWAFWLYNGGLVLWIALNFFPIGWPQLAAVYEHGLAYARSVAFDDQTLLWQWMRLPGDVVFALGALLMAWDFAVKGRPLLPQLVGRWIPGSETAGIPAGE
jgi:nitric oxide reductase large subunit